MKGSMAAKRRQFRRGTLFPTFNDSFVFSVVVEGDEAEFDSAAADALGAAQTDAAATHRQLFRIRRRRTPFNLNRGINDCLKISPQGAHLLSFQSERS